MALMPTSGGARGMPRSAHSRFRVVHPHHEESMRSTTTAALRLTALAAAIAATSGSAFAATSLRSSQPQIVRSDAGRPVAAARADGPGATLKAALAARGRDGSTLAALQQA